MSETVVSAAVSVIWQGVVLAIYCALVVSSIDNFLRPLFLRGTARIHPLWPPTYPVGTNSVAVIPYRCSSGIRTSSTK